MATVPDLRAAVAPGGEDPESGFRRFLRRLLTALVWVGGSWAALQAFTRLPATIPFPFNWIALAAVALWAIYWIIPQRVRTLAALVLRPVRNAWRAAFRQDDWQAQFAAREAEILGRLKIVTDQMGGIADGVQQLQSMETSVTATLEQVDERVQNLAGLNETMLFRRLAGQNGSSVGKYHIIFSHKDDREHPKYNPGSDELYSLPPVPFDEFDGLLRVSHHLWQNPWMPFDKVRSCCSCSVDEERYAKLIYQDSFTILGSPKANRACKALMEALETATGKRQVRREEPYVMTVDRLSGESDGDKRAYLKSPDDTKMRSLWPDSTVNAARDTRSLQEYPQDLIDYAVFMKLPNLLDDVSRWRNSTILVLAGCKAGGQCGLTRWLFDHNLAALDRQYRDQYFEVRLKVNYKFVKGGMPRILGDPIVERTAPIELHI
jgi:hypothetical protein